MDYGLLFAGMGTALAFFIYKTISLSFKVTRAKRIIIGMALGVMTVKVNRKTHEIDLNWKEGQ